MEDYIKFVYILEKSEDQQGEAAITNNEQNNESKKELIDISAKETEQKLEQYNETE